MSKRTNVIRKGDCGVLVRNLIARHYLRLMDKYCTDKSGRTYLSMTASDMFHHAITLILQDGTMNKYEKESEALDRIEQRIRNVISEIKQDHHQDKTKEYADNIQAEATKIE